MPEGKEFITHEMDEGISVHQAIIAAEEKLADVHPLPEVQQALKRMLEVDTRQLETLKELGKPFGTKGTLEDVSRALSDLMKETARKAALKKAEPSDAYEAHAVLLNLKRKQQDSAAAIAQIADHIREPEIATSARHMNKTMAADSESLAASLAKLAVQLATAG